tara:strand:+ start:133 stop:1929 length:1797 start_codon:yes stop_codon:yes gene_type:complete
VAYNYYIRNNKKKGILPILNKRLKMTEQVLVNPQVLEKLLAIVSEEKEKPRLEMEARALFAGQQIPMTITEAYAEHIMNVYDLSTECAGRSINMWLYAKYTKDKVSSIIIQDDGPGLPSGAESILSQYLKISVNNKANNENLTIGDAGIGGKAANAKLAKRHTYIWSWGDGKKCEIIFDEDTFTELDGYQYNEYDYEGSSFFKIVLEKLRSTDTRAPSECRPELEEKFRKRLITHPSVSIYTSDPERNNKKNKLIPPPEMTYIKPYKWEGTVTWAGYTAEVSVGMIDASVHPSGLMPTVYISKQGVVHFKKTESPAHKYLFINKNGSSTHFTPLHRNILLSIDSKHLASSQIKNDLNWDDEVTIGMLKAVGYCKEVKEMIQSVHDYNALNKSEKMIPPAHQKNIDALTAAAAAGFNEVLKGDENAGKYNSNPSNIDSSKTTSEKRSLKPTKHLKNSNKKPSQPSININGKKHIFKIKFVHTNDSHSRFYVEVCEGVFILNINCSFRGYISMVEKDKVELVYLADTIGMALQNYSIKKKISDSNNSALDEEDINQISLSRDAIVADCLTALQKPAAAIGITRRAAAKRRFNAKTVKAYA